VVEPALPIRLIVGLGNPGSEYACTRHNAGWWFVDALAAQRSTVWRRDSRRNLDVAPLHSHAAQLWLIKPTAFMNRSGLPVAEFVSFYRIDTSEILIVHDEIDLPPGVARLKYGGGHGGHNGLRDVIEHLGAQFWRLRLGVGHPGSKDLVIDAVLDRPPVIEQEQIEQALKRALEVIPELLAGETQRAIHRLHSGNPKPARSSDAADPSTSQE
jgi:PTH1 family peptidyl-tRNA hydrolase